MSFWNSRNINKTRKEHMCIFCLSKIPIGSSCSHQSGMWEGEFNDYRLCNRCLKFIDEYKLDLSDGFSAGDFHEYIHEFDVLNCPNCGRDNHRDCEWSENSYKAEIECDNCGRIWTADVSMGFDEFGRSVNSDG